MNCLPCGSSALVTGTVLDTNGGTIGFKLDDVSIWKSMFGVGIRKVRANGCVHCGHMQLAVDFSENDVKRYQQFEGEQPGVLDPINSDTEKLDS